MVQEMPIKAIIKASDINSKLSAIIVDKMKAMNIGLEELSINDIVKSNDIYEIRLGVKNFDIKTLCLISQFIGVDLIKHLHNDK